MSLLYKTLFEVKLLHEYYLTDGEGNTIFSLSNQQDRLRFLLNAFSGGRDAINKDLGFAFPESRKSGYQGCDIQLIPGYSGFKIMIRVKQQRLADNTLVFEPFSDLPDHIFIRIIKKNEQFNRYTRLKTRNILPATYLFSNERLTGPKVFPFLTNSIAPFSAAAEYEQGELAAFGPGDIREFYIQDALEKWDTINGQAFASPGDLLLLPRRFSYALSTAGISRAEFVLKDASGSTLKTVLVTDTSLRNVLLDFSDQPESFPDPAPGPVADTLYTLEVQGDNGFFQRQPVALSDSFSEATDAGLIHIATKPANADFNLVAADGFLFKRRSPLGIWSPAPVFEIAFKGKSAFWRYINNKGHKILLHPEVEGYLLEEDNFLVSPRPLTVFKNHVVLLRREGSAETKYFPNPTDYLLKRDDRERLFFDILVPESKLFPIAI
jgi:hypothetical protein